MRTIKDGKKYDTRTATEVARQKNGYKTGAYDVLYRTKSGAFFIATAATEQDLNSAETNNRRATRTSNTYINTCFTAIQPITEQEARAFVEKNDTVEKYELVFGYVDE